MKCYMVDIKFEINVKEKALSKPANTTALEVIRSLGHLPL